MTQKTLASRANLCVFSLLLLLSSLLTLSTLASASVQTAMTPTARVTAKVNNSQRVTLSGHKPAILSPAKDLGRVAPSTQADHLMLVLKSSPEQKQELRRIVDEQQDQRSVNYHQWMTPEEFGAHFGVADSDLAQ